MSMPISTPMRRFAIRLLPLLLLWCASAAPAFAAPPTDAQIDRLFAALDMPRLVDQIVAQMDQGAAIGAEHAIGPDPTPGDRARMQRVLDRQHDALRMILSWDKLSPVYRRIYAQAFTAEEVEAMIAFYGSDTGRSILAKLPQAMQLATDEMRPMIEETVDRMQRDIQRELGDDKPAPDHR